MNKEDKANMFQTLTELKDYEDLFRRVAHKIPEDWKTIFSKTEIKTEINEWFLGLAE